MKNDSIKLTTKTKITSKMAKKIAKEIEKKIKEQDKKHESIHMVVPEIFPKEMLKLSRQESNLRSICDKMKTNKPTTKKEKKYPFKIWTLLKVCATSIIVLGASTFLFDLSVELYRKALGLIIMIFIILYFFADHRDEFTEEHDEGYDDDDEL